MQVECQPERDIGIYDRLQGGVRFDSSRSPESKQILAGFWRVQHGLRTRCGALCTVPCELSICLILC